LEEIQRQRISKVLEPGCTLIIKFLMVILLDKYSAPKRTSKQLLNLLFSDFHFWLKFLSLKLVCGNMLTLWKIKTLEREVSDFRNFNVFDKLVCGMIWWEGRTWGLRVRFQLWDFNWILYCCPRVWLCSPKTKL